MDKHENVLVLGSREWWSKGQASSKLRRSPWAPSSIPFPRALATLTIRSLNWARVYVQFALPWPPRNTETGPRDRAQRLRRTKIQPNLLLKLKLVAGYALKKNLPNPVWCSTALLPRPRRPRRR